MEQYIRSELLNRFEFQNYGHALECFQAFPESGPIFSCLASLKISVSDLTEAGGTKLQFPRSLTMYCTTWLAQK